MAPPRDTPVLDMTPDGRFRPPPRPTLPLATRMALAAGVVAALAAALGVAALALWLAFMLIPLAVGAGVVAYLAFRFQLWRTGARQRPAPPVASRRR